VPGAVVVDNTFSQSLVLARQLPLTGPHLGHIGDNGVTTPAGAVRQSSRRVRGPMRVCERFPAI